MVVNVLFFSLGKNVASHVCKNIFHIKQNDGRPCFSFILSFGICKLAYSYKAKNHLVCIHCMVQAMQAFMPGFSKYPSKVSPPPPWEVLFVGLGC